MKTKFEKTKRTVSILALSVALPTFTWSIHITDPDISIKSRSKKNIQTSEDQTYNLEDKEERGKSLQEAKEALAARRKVLQEKKAANISEENNLTQEEKEEKERSLKEAKKAIAERREILCKNKTEAERKSQESQKEQEQYLLLTNFERHQHIDPANELYRDEGSYLKHASSINAIFSGNPPIILSPADPNANILIKAKSKKNTEKGPIDPHIMYKTLKQELKAHEDQIVLINEDLDTIHNITKKGAYPAILNLNNNNILLRDDAINEQNNIIIDFCNFEKTYEKNNFPLSYHYEIITKHSAAERAAIKRHALIEKFLLNENTKRIETVYYLNDLIETPIVGALKEKDHLEQELAKLNKQQIVSSKIKNLMKKEDKRGKELELRKQHIDFAEQSGTIQGYCDVVMQDLKAIEDFKENGKNLKILNFEIELLKDPCLSNYRSIRNELQTLFKYMTKCCQDTKDIENKNITIFHKYFIGSKDNIFKEDLKKIKEVHMQLDSTILDLAKLLLLRKLQTYHDSYFKLYESFNNPDPWINNQHRDIQENQKSTLSQISEIEKKYNFNILLDEMNIQKDKLRREVHEKIDSFGPAFKSIDEAYKILNIKEKPRMTLKEFIEDPLPIHPSLNRPARSLDWLKSKKSTPSIPCPSVGGFKRSNTKRMSGLNHLSDTEYDNFMKVCPFTNGNTTVKVNFSNPTKTTTLNRPGVIIKKEKPAFILNPIIKDSIEDDLMNDPIFGDLIIEADILMEKIEKKYMKANLEELPEETKNELMKRTKHVYANRHIKRPKWMQIETEENFDTLTPKSEKDKVILEKPNTISVSSTAAHRTHIDKGDEESSYEDLSALENESADLNERSASTPNAREDLKREIEDLKRKEEYENNIRIEKEKKEKSVKKQKEEDEKIKTIMENVNKKKEVNLIVHMKDEDPKKNENAQANQPHHETPTKLEKDDWTILDNSVKKENFPGAEVPEFWFLDENWKQNLSPAEKDIILIDYHKSQNYSLESIEIMLDYHENNKNKIIENRIIPYMIESYK